jgi:hypothetical protein
MRMSLRCRVVLTLLVFFPPIVFAQKKGSAATPASASPAAAAPASSSGAFESQMLAFGSMGLIAGDIANRVCVADSKASSC